MNKNIYFVTPDMNVHSRGILNIYKNVINLNKLGYKAYVVHFNTNFKMIQWYKFGKDMPFLKFHYLDKLFVINEQGQFIKANREFGENDIWIIPEGFPALFPIFKQTFKFTCKMYMYAQGWSYILPSLTSVFGGQIPHLSQIGVEGVITVSDCVKQYIIDLFNFPEELIFMLPNYIDTSIFNSDLGVEKVEDVIEDESGNLDIVEVEKPAQKKNKICFMPRRGEESVYQTTIALIDKKLKGAWELKPLINMTQEQIAKELKQSKIFMHYTSGDGFAMPPLEAVMTSNVVVGNAGLGSLEYLQDALWVNPDDCRDPYAYCEAIEEAIKMISDLDYSEYKETLEELKERYSEINYLKALDEIFKKLVV